MTDSSQLNIMTKSKCTDCIHTHTEGSKTKDWLRKWSINIITYAVLKMEIDNNIGNNDYTRINFLQENSVIVHFNPSDQQMSIGNKEWIMMDVSATRRQSQFEDCDFQIIFHHQSGISEIGRIDANIGINMRKQLNLNSAMLRSVFPMTSEQLVDYFNMQEAPMYTRFHLNK